MYVRPLAIDDDAEMHAFYVAQRAAETAENPDRPVWTEEVMLGFIREPTQDQKVEGWAALTGAPGDSDATIIGGGLMFIPQLDNLDKAYLSVAVEPTHERKGTGSAILDQMVPSATGEHARTTLLLESTIPFAERENHGYRRFAERHGFSMANVEVSRRLALPVDDDQLQGFLDEAAQFHQGYRIETYHGIPDHLIDSVCYLGNQLALDAPTGDIDFEAEQITPEIRREADERAKRRGIEKLETVAVGPSGDAVAISTIAVIEGDPDRAHQWITIVHREHRGHRLGLAVKAANLRVLQREHPERTAIFTQNNETNANMVGINERFGFEPIELCVEFQRIIASA